MKMRFAYVLVASIVEDGGTISSYPLNDGWRRRIQGT